ncbi:hypothetical protein Zmor_014690 [Zophobas morio]|uniref:Uncharacterized protein n=1 Tax=Zophobas morio TaxID=2755281 RepID=A0AA38MGC2_9CUCU|nr:hypothetical protein Zmor_003794 [Zophobas morio]KAJ3655567.1 hypothetical protein Zmor_014690 [Zophobas morio]
MWTVGEQVCLQQYNRVVLDGNLMMCGHDSTVYVIQINCTTVASNGTLECEWPALGLPKWWIIIKDVEVTEKFIIYDDITCNGKITTCFTGIFHQAFLQFRGKFKEASEAGFFIVPGITRWSTTIVHVTMKKFSELLH